MFEPNQDDEATQSGRKRLSPAVGFGSSFAGGMAVFALGGHWLDRKTGHESLFTLIGIGLGFLYGAWELWKLITMANQAEKNKDPNQPDKKESSQNASSE